MIRSRAVLIVVLLLSVAGAATAQDNAIPKAIAFSSARTSAFGGVHTALADDLTTLFNNPAGFRAAESELSVAELTLGLAGPIFDITSVIVEGADLTSPNVQNLLKNLFAGLNLVGPLALGYVGDGLGFGLYNNILTEFSSQGTIPTFTARIGMEFVFAGGYAFRIPFQEDSKSDLDIGALLKIRLSGVTSTVTDLLGLQAVFSDPLSLLMGGPFDLTVGAGIDLGFRYAYNERFAFGLVARDLPGGYLNYSYTTILGLGPETPTESSFWAPIDLSAGMLFRPPLGILSRYFSDFKLMLDYNDMLDFLTHPASATNPLLHVGFGLELVLLEVLSIRGGFSQGLFSAGLGFDLSVFTLDMAMFGTELSTEPGIRPVYNLIIGLGFRL